MCYFCTKPPKGLTHNGENREGFSTAENILQSLQPVPLDRRLGPEINIKFSKSIKEMVCGFLKAVHVGCSPGALGFRSLVEGN